MKLTYFGKFFQKEKEDGKTTYYCLGCAMKFRTRSGVRSHYYRNHSSTPNSKPSSPPQPKTAQNPPVCTQKTPVYPPPPPIYLQYPVQNPPVPPIPPNRTLILPVEPEDPDEKPTPPPLKHIYLDEYRNIVEDNLAMDKWVQAEVDRKNRLYIKLMKAEYHKLIKDEEDLDKERNESVRRNVLESMEQDKIYKEELRKIINESVRRKVLKLMEQEKIEKEKN